MTTTSPSRRPRLPSHLLLLLLPLLATGCSRTQAALVVVITSTLVACGVLLFFAGFAVGADFCCRTYRHWEGVFGEEYRTDLLRLTDASVEVAREADAAIRACRAALRSLRRSAADIR